MPTRNVELLWKHRAYKTQFLQKVIRMADVAGGREVDDYYAASIAMSGYGEDEFLVWTEGKYTMIREGQVEYPAVAETPHEKLTRIIGAWKRHPEVLYMYPEMPVRYSDEMQDRILEITKVWEEVAKMGAKQSKAFNADVKMNDVVEELALLKTADSDWVDEALYILQRAELTWAQFSDLDEKPGKWGYEVRGRAWHWKLRVLRNLHWERLKGVLVISK